MLFLCFSIHFQFFLFHLSTNFSWNFWHLFLSHAFFFYLHCFLFAFGTLFFARPPNRCFFFDLRFFPYDFLLLHFFFDLIVFPAYAFSLVFLLMAFIYFFLFSLFPCYVFTIVIWLLQRNLLLNHCWLTSSGGCHLIAEGTHNKGEQPHLAKLHL